MNDEILKLAKECFGEPRLMSVGALEAFYKVAYNNAIEDVVKLCNVYDSTTQWATPMIKAVRSLEMK